MTVILWALLTGAVSGGVWVAIVLLQRQRRLTEAQRRLLDDAARRLDELDETFRRLAEVEERLEFAERLLRTQAERRSLEPPHDP